MRYGYQSWGGELHLTRAELRDVGQELESKGKAPPPPQSYIWLLCFSPILPIIPLVILNLTQGEEALYGGAQSAYGSMVEQEGEQTVKATEQKMENSKS